MALASGTYLGPYEILAPLGAGGMGEVYRARDTRLGRDVALKALPEALAKDADRLLRFEQEARVLGTLNHPNLLAIFDVFHDWFQKREDFDGCSFINVLLELGAAHPARQASIQYLDTIRTIVRERAEAAGLVDVDDFARSWHILMKGSIIAATEGDLQAARRAQAMGRSVINDTDRQPKVESHISG